MIAALIGALVSSSAPSFASPSAFTIMASAEGTKVKFAYLLSLPVDAATGWVAGDRVAYRCAYMFLRSGGELVARVTFTRIEYAKVNDKRMDEAARYYDGTVYTGSARQLNDCPAPTEPYVEATGPIGPLPVITFSDASTGATLEVRDYRNVVQTGGVPWEFQIVAATPDRVSVVAYQSREPVVAIYYDRLSPSITLSSNETSLGTGSPDVMSWAWAWRWASHRS